MVIDHNRYRLILKVNFSRKTLYFVGIFTHKEYDRKRWRNGCRQPATNKLDLEQYGKLLAAFVPRPIKTEVERKRMSAAIKDMLNKDLTPGEEVLFQLLVKLVTDYKDQLVQYRRRPRAVMLQYLMENTGLKQVDLAKILGTGRGGVSDILNGKRSISRASRAQAKLVAERFKVAADLFL